MFNNRTTDGRNNICGINVAKLRKALKISQRELADRLQVINLAKVFSVTVEDLLKV